MRCIVRRLAMLSVLLLGLAASRSAAAPDPVSKRIDAFVREELERQKVPGVGIGIVKNGKVLLAKGYGFANLEHQVPVKPETIFQAGSVGKQFTAMAVMLQVELVLVEQGSQGDDRLYTYRVTFGTKTYQFAVALAPDDRPASLGLRPR